MRRLISATILLTVLVTAASAATAEAASSSRKRVERTVEGSYATQFVPFNINCRQHGGMGCVEIKTRKREAFLSAKAVDAHGQPVRVSVSTPDPSGRPGEWIEYGTFCGQTEEPIAFDRGVDLYLIVGYFWVTDLESALESCPPMFGTTGTINATLSNLP